ncbi:hypothetical protein BD770DRAFT_461032 [Pilaira anomala]|nr:hypothetical protein BD770DRAFT_461032 [Pilaira anomala]
MTSFRSFFGIQYSKSFVHELNEVSSCCAFFFFTKLLSAESSLTSVFFPLISVTALFFPLLAFF